MHNLLPTYTPPKVLEITKEELKNVAVVFTTIATV